MKLKYLKAKATQPIEGIRSGIIPNTLEGDSVAVASGDNLLLVKLSDLIAFINEQEAAEQKEASTCPA